VTKEHRFSKNYTLQKLSSSNVGDPIVKVQDFWIETIEEPIATVSADLDATITGSLMANQPWVFQKGKSYEIKGSFEIDGLSYQVVASSEIRDRKSGSPVRMGGAWGGLLVKNDGTILPAKLIYGLNTGSVVAVGASISDTTVLVKNEKKLLVDTSKGYENYEIIYTGINSSGINFTYREFSPDGLARVAFYQNLTYPVGVNRISFKKFRISIEDSGAEKISYRVLEDGISEGGSAVGGTP
jgi:hypothetical protein